MEYISNLPVDFWITLATVIITLILGQVTKKFTNIDKKKIPLQNMFIGMFVFLVEYLITKELSIAIALSGIFSGGMYDLGKAFMQLINKEEK
jgi:hypothetical protein